MDPLELTRRIREEAGRLGFDAVGVAPAEAVPPQRLQEWLRREYHGRMEYLSRGAEKRLNPELVLPGARSVVTTALNYHHPYPLPYHRPDRGVISRYAAGDDYHRVMEKRLRTLLERVRELAPGTEGKAYVDTGPVMDKYWAARSGLGWLGKHTNVIAGKDGSWFFLGELLLNVELESDPPASDHCGSCTACIEACPTEAIVEPYVLDGRRCISYLTIELKDDIPIELRAPMKNLIYGCDICQDVCPWNGSPAASRVEAFRPRSENREPQLRELARLSPEEFRQRTRHSPIRRPKWRGFLRNVAVAMGNSRDPRMIPELFRLLESDDAMVRRHAAWALLEFGSEEAVEAVRERLERETDPRTARSLQDLLQGEGAGPSRSG